MPYPQPPIATTQAVTDITQTSVTLNGAADCNYTTITAVQFNYGLTTSLGSIVEGTPNSIVAAPGVSTPVSASLTELLPNTTYYYALYLVGQNLEFNQGVILSFTTLAAITLPPMRSRKGLKAFIRYDGSGRVVPSGVILARKKPKVGKWVEGLAYLCCNFTTTTTSTTSSTTTHTTTSTTTTATPTTTTTTTVPATTTTTTTHTTTTTTTATPTTTTTTTHPATTTTTTTS